MNIPTDIEKALCGRFECTPQELPNVLTGMDADRITRELCAWYLGDKTWWGTIKRWNKEAKKIENDLRETAETK